VSLLLLFNQGSGSSQTLSPTDTPTRTWVVPAAAIAAIAILAQVGPAVQTWNVPQAAISSQVTLAQVGPAIGTWVAKDGALQAQVSLAGTPASRSWVALDGAIQAQASLAQAGPSTRSWVTLDGSVAAGSGPQTLPEIGSDNITGDPVAQAWVTLAGTISQAETGPPATRSWVVGDGAVQVPFDQVLDQVIAARSWWFVGDGAIQVEALGSTAQYLWPDRPAHPPTPEHTTEERELLTVLRQGPPIRKAWIVGRGAIELAPIVEFEPDVVVRVRGQELPVARSLARVLSQRPAVSHDELDAAMSYVPTEEERRLPELYEQTRRQWCDFWGFEIETVSSDGDAWITPPSTELAAARAVIRRALPR
jgi:hypothetical protein